MTPRGVLIASGIFSPDIGGPASYARELGVRLARSMPVTVLTYSPVPAVAEDAALPFRTVRVWRGLPKGLRHARYAASAIRHARDHDVVLALNPVTAGLPALAGARMANRRFFVKVVGDYAWEQAVNAAATPFLLDDFQHARTSVRSRLLHAVQSRVCRQADTVVVPSAYLAGIVRGWGVRAERLAVVYNGTAFTPSPLSRGEARHTLRLSGTVVLSIGRLVPWKGFRTLIELVPRLRTARPDIHLVIAGEGPERSTLETVVSRLGLESCVTLVGRQSHAELADYLAAADLFVLNTGYEGFSHQLLEVMSAGVPLVTTRVGGNPELIEDEENGLLVGYNDTDALAGACGRLLEDAPLRARLAEAGRRRAARFTIDRMLDETVELLRRVR